MNNIMIDIETLGVKGLPAIISIGWCLFDEDKILGSGEMFPQVEGSIDSGTVMWWMKQSDAARECQTNAARNETLEQCLLRLGSFIEDSDITGVWANGVSFDLRILREWYSEKGLDIPWHFRQERCLRSFRELGVERVVPEIAHSAESDAIAQAKTVQEVWQRV